ncbi:hypothetical protein ACFL6U_13645 [Planctomycetota bacterium]
MRLLLRSILLLSLWGLLPLAGAGILEDFEQDATQDRSRERRQCDPYDPYNYPHRQDHSQDQPAVGLHMSFLTGAKHEPGDPTLPYVRFDGAYQGLEPQVHAYDYYAQIGYQAIGLDMRHTHYREERPRARLDVNRMHVLFRMGTSWSAQDSQRRPQGFYEIDLGIGMAQLQGTSKNSGISFTLPVMLYPTPYWGFEFRPAWADINRSWLRDFDISMHILLKFVGLKVGYRWLKGPNSTLDGPYAGVTMRF